MGLAERRLLHTSGSRMLVWGRCWIGEGGKDGSGVKFAEAEVPSGWALRSENPMEREERLQIVGTSSAKVNTV